MSRQLQKRSRLYFVTNFWDENRYSPFLMIGTLPQVGIYWEIRPPISPKTSILLAVYNYIVLFPINLSYALKLWFCPSILVCKSGVLRFHPATNKKQVCLEFLYFSTFSLLDSGLTRGREWQVHILFLYFLTFLWASHFSNRRLTCERWNSQLVDSHRVYKRTRYR